MSSTDEVNAFLQSQGAKAFPFENVGDAVSGIIIDMAMRQQTDINTGEPQFWADGSPKRMMVLTLQTELQADENDDGIRSVYLRGGNYTVASGKGTSSLTALRDALRAAGVKELETGGKLALAYTGTGTKSNNAFTAPKLYSCKYEAPTRNVSVDELF
jgi:hypothetical protein